MTTTSTEDGGHAPTARTQTIAAPSTAGLMAFGFVLKEDIMSTRTIIFAAATAVLFAGPALGGSAKKASDLIAVYNSLNEGCRGGHGDDPSTDRACDARNIISRSLTKAGYCYTLLAGWRKCH